MLEPTVDPDGVSLSEEEDPTLDLVNDLAIIIIGTINQSIDPLI